MINLSNLQETILFILLIKWFSYILSHCWVVLFNIYPEQQKSLPLLCKIYKKKKDGLYFYISINSQECKVLSWSGMVTILVKCLQCIGKSLLIVNQNLSVNHWVISKTQISLFCDQSSGHVFFVLNVKKK